MQAIGAGLLLTGLCHALVFGWAEGRTTYPWLVALLVHSSLMLATSLLLQSMTRPTSTEGTLRMLDDRELEGVIAHELAHVKHRDILTSSVAATIAAAIMMVARWAGYAAMFGGMSDRRDRGANPVALLATIILAPLAALLVQSAISRSREFAADAGGAKIAGNPYGLVDALRKLEIASKQVPLDANPATSHMFIVNPFSSQGLMGLFSTHPSTEKRIEALLHISR